MQLTLTITGTTDELRRVLGALHPELEEPADDDTSPLNPDQFVENLTELGRTAVKEVARVSVLGSFVPRAQLSKTMSLTPAELAGVFGGIGIHWARASKLPNPFRGRWDNATRDFRYSVERELAQQLLSALGEPLIPSP